MQALRILTLFLLTICTGAAGIERELPPPDFYGRHADALGLTAEQRERLHDIVQRGEREFRAVREELGRRESALRDVVTDGARLKRGGAARPN